VGASTFQLQLYSAGPVLARFVYQDVDFGSTIYDNGVSATIGYQVSASEAYQFSFNSAVLTNGDVIDITPQDDAVPEPSTLWLAVPALLAVGAFRRRR
jgi:MYXO-CTERM domain-containing protein